MKRILFALVMLFLFSIPAFAASSETWTVYEVDGSRWVEVAVTFICDGDGGTYTTTVFKNSNNQTLNLAGYYLYHIAYYFGTTAPTDNSDLTVFQHSATGRDILHGAGANMIDNAGNTNFQPWINGTEAPMPIYGPLYLAITNNIVNSATGTIIFRFIR